MARIRRVPKITISENGCFGCQNRSRAEWCVLVDDELQLLNSSKSPARYGSGEVVYFQGDPCTGIYCIESGTVAIRKEDSNGNSILVRLAHEGQTVGYRDYFGGRDYTTSVETLTPSTLCHVSSGALQSLLDHNPNLGLRFLTHIAADLESADESILHQAALSVRARLAHLLLSLKDRYGAVDENGNIVLSLPMARRDIAALLGTTPESIARSITALESEGVLWNAGRKVVIPDLDNLLNVIDPGPF